MPAPLNVYKDILEAKEPKREEIEARCQLRGPVERFHRMPLRQGRGRVEQNLPCRSHYIDARPDPELSSWKTSLERPWLQYENIRFPKIGYAASHVKVDSKDYYIPQTRNRGYLIAVDAATFGDQAPEITSHRASFMKGLRAAGFNTRD